MKASVCALSWSTLRLPLRSWIRKLKPDEEPNPEIVGMLKGMMMPSGMAEKARLSLLMMAIARSSGAFRFP